jgi:hypothetical protein
MKHHHSINPDWITDHKSEFRFWKVRKQIFEGSNWSFDPSELYAESYDWWPMLMVVRGKLVRNTHSYSNSTGRHQAKLNTLLNQLGIVPDLTISVRASLNSDTLVKQELLELWAKDELRSERARLYKTNRYADQLQKARRFYKITQSDMLMALNDARKDEANDRESARAVKERTAEQERQRLDNMQERLNEHYAVPQSSFGRNFTLIQGGRA